MTYKLHIGRHKGTAASRDSEVRQFDSLDECVNSYERSRGIWRSTGYQVWFARAVDGDGDTVKTWPGNSYDR